MTDLPCYMELGERNFQFIRFEGQSKRLAPTLAQWERLLDHNHTRLRQCVTWCPRDLYLLAVESKAVGMRVDPPIAADLALQGEPKALASVIHDEPDAPCVSNALRAGAIKFHAKASQRTR